MRERSYRWLPVLAVVLALSFAAVAAAGTGLRGGTVDAAPPLRPDPEQGGQVAGTPPPQAFSQEGERLFGVPLEWLYYLYLTLLGVSVAMLLIYLAYLLHHAISWLLTTPVRQRAFGRQAASQPDEEEQVAEVRRALQAGLAEIDTGGDPRRAVIDCWLRLERAAAAAGTARQVADTPGDLVARLLSRHRISPDALERLAGAYRRARYAPAEVGGQLAGAARAALADVRAHLEAPAGGARRAGG